MGILASELPPPDWLAYVNTGGTVGILILIIYAWMTGRIVRAGDAQKLMEARDSNCEVRVSALEKEISRLSDELEHVKADRAAWRDTHTDDVAARQAAERAAAQLMESANLTASLISLVRESIGRPTARGAEDGHAQS